MIRYFAIAAAIVFACILALLSIGHRATPQSTPAPYNSSVASAGPARPEATSAATALPLQGDAPWALSALPGCFHQTRELRGTPGFVRAHAADLHPAGWKPVARGILVTADCRLDVLGDSGIVARGDDTRLRIPPETRFFVDGKRLVVDRVARGTENVRVYTLRDGNAPRFTVR